MISLCDYRVISNHLIPSIDISVDLRDMVVFDGYSVSSKMATCSTLYPDFQAIGQSPSCVTCPALLTRQSLLQTYGHFHLSLSLASTTLVSTNVR